MIQEPIVPVVVCCVVAALFSCIGYSIGLMSVRSAAVDARVAEWQVANSFGRTVFAWKGFHEIVEERFGMEDDEIAELIRAKRA